MTAASALSPAATRMAPDPQLQVSLLGVGAMGGHLVDLLEAGRIDGCALATTIRSTTANPLLAGLLARTDLLAGTDVLVEAAGAEAARVWVPAAVAAGVDVVLCSCGVLADPAFLEALAASGGTGRVLVPSGAIGGLDLFAAASRAARTGEPGTTVLLTTTKTPAALGVSTETPLEVFRGTAREAALAHPKTANVAVALALATIGMDQVSVVMVADPQATRTRHVVTMSSPMGEYELTVLNSVAPGSGGRTSAVTPWSVVTLLEALAAGHGAGLLVHPPTTHKREDTR
jgi:aspartate dehydrogenase